MQSRQSRCSIIVSLVLVSISLWALAAGGVALSFRFGFDDQLIRYRYAPLRIELAGLDAPFVGRIVVKQFAGPDPSQPVTLAHEIADGTLDNGTYWATVPAYDAVLPVLVQLLDADGTLVASASASVRQSARGLPFAVIAGKPIPLGGTESIVSVAELPKDWWAYDSVRSLWVTEPLTDQAAWTALGQWVVSGGSLVLFSGSDFYQWDSPTARDLLPLAHPTAQKASDGTYLLTGTPRAGSQVLLSRDGEPLLLRIARGAGQVNLVTVRPEDLTPLEVERIAARVPAARRLTGVDRYAERLLNESPVLRPLYAFAPIIVAVVAAAFLAFHRYAARRFGVALLGLLLTIAVVSVSSGLYVNRIGSVAYQYSIITSLSVNSSFGIDIDSYAFFALDSTPTVIEHAPKRFPIQAESWITIRDLYGLASETDETTLFLPARARRFVRACGSGQPEWRLVVSKTERNFRIENYSSLRATAAMLFLDGLYYAVPMTADGSPASEFAFSDLRHVSASGMTREESALYGQVADWLPLSVGTWLLTYSESDDVHSTPGEMPEKVSLVRMSVVEGERSS